MSRRQLKRKVNHIWHLWHYLGPQWLAYRLSYAARLRTGLLRRQLPATGWAEQPLYNFLSDSAPAEPESYLVYRRSQAPLFFFDPSRRKDYEPHFAVVGWQSQRAHHQSDCRSIMN